MLLGLPASPSDLLAAADDALQHFPARMVSDAARLQLVATALQETGGRTRVQTNGPARGFWQAQLNFVDAVANNAASARLLVEVCDAIGAPYAARKIYGRLTSNDTLAAAMCRLGYWCDPLPLPAFGDGVAAWYAYDRAQRPGKPDIGRWNNYSYPMALALFQQAAA